LINIRLINIPSLCFSECKKSAAFSVICAAWNYSFPFRTGSSNAPAPTIAQPQGFGEDRSWPRTLRSFHSRSHSLTSALPNKGHGREHCALFIRAAIP